MNILPAAVRDYSLCLADVLMSSSRLSNGQGDGSCLGWEIDCDGEKIFLPATTETGPVKRLLKSCEPPYNRGGREYPPAYSVLVARSPRWPINHILLVARGGHEDRAVFEWTFQISASTRAKVTILPIIPDIPRFYSRAGLSEAVLEHTLLQGAAAENHLLRLIRRLLIHGLEVNVRSHPMAPDEQLRLEVELSACDLLVLRGENRGPVWSAWMGELVGPLLRWIDRPVLICRPG